MTDYFPLLIAFFVVILTFIAAMNSGVVKLLASASAAAVLLLILALGVQLIPVVAERFLDLEMTFKATLGISSVVAILGYTVSRFFFGWFFRKLLGPDSWFHWMADGIPGGILSVFPSLVIVFFLFNCTRIAGTVLELNYVASLCQEQITKTISKIPPYPFAATWRNKLDAIPGLPAALDFVDPFSHRTRRNTAAMVMIHRSDALKQYCEEQSETSPLIQSPDIEALSQNDKVVAIYQTQNRVEMVTHPEIRLFASTYEQRDELRDLKLEPLLTRFVSTLKPVPVPVPVETN